MAASRSGNLHSRLLRVALAGSLMSSSGAVLAGEPRYNAKATPAPFSWTGFYAGANAGYAWAQSDARSSSDCPATGYYCPTGFQPNGTVLAGLGSGGLGTSGFTGGVQAGYNWQRGQLVLGGEVDVGAFGLGASRFASALAPVGGAGQSFGAGSTIDTDWLFTARARLGVAVAPTVLAYVTGGLALTGLHVSNFYKDTAGVVVGNNGAGAATNSKVQAGWTVGGGVEVALDRNWTLKGEYLYIDFGDVRVASVVRNPSPVFAGTSNLLTTSTDLTAHIARLGINYKF